MNTKQLTLSVMLGVAMAWTPAHAAQFETKGTFAGDFVAGPDTNGDGIFSVVGTNAVDNFTQLGKFSVDFTAESFPVIPTPGVCLPNRVEFRYLYDAGVGTQEVSGAQYFFSYTSAVACLDVNTGKFTFSGEAVYTGGTGQFTGIAGSFTVKGTGILNKDTSGMFDGSGSQKGTFAASFTLPIVCPIANFIAAGKTADSLLACEAKGTKAGAAVDPDCVNKAADTFATTLAKEQAAAIKAGDQCRTDNTPPDTEGDVDAFVMDIATALRPMVDASKCAAAKLDAVGSFVSALTAAHVKNTETPDPDKLAKALAKADAQIGKAFDKAETLKNGNCLTTADAPMSMETATTFIRGVLPCVEIGIDPRKTYLATSQDPDAMPAMPLALSQDFNFASGDEIFLSVGGDLSFCLTCPEIPSALAGLFSATPDVTGAIFVSAPPYVSPPTIFNNIPTDIPQDFSIPVKPGMVSLIVPSGASHLFLIVADGFYGDNMDSDSNLSVRLCR